jgi:two-component system cell cycle response regulator
VTAHRVLLALHGLSASPALADGLSDHELELVVTRTMAETWVAARARPPDAILLVPLTADADSPEYASLLALSAAPDGPALLVVTDDPERLPARVADAVDFLPPDATPLQAAMRVRFVVGRRRSLARVRAEQARLSRDAITDFKTGLFNDRYFTERCREESARARRTRRPVAVMAMDFDDFKAINDTYGHECGDRALAAFAQALRTSLRASDVPARVGGDEFVALLPDSDLDDAALVADRVRQLVARLVVEHAGANVPLSVSFGVSAVTYGQVHTVEDAVRAADDALLSAKRAGRALIYGRRPEEIRAAPARLGKRGKKKAAEKEEDGGDEAAAG